MHNDHTLRAKYYSFMKEYLELGHMQLCNEPSAYFLPHHAMIKEDTTIFRVMFDASYRTPRTSLNECLLTGLTLQLDIRIFY